MATSTAYDLAIIGAGPAGLFAAYYAGFRGLKAVVFDGLPQVGGQISTMYPEKLIHDVAGFEGIRGASLVDGLVRQSNRHAYDLKLSEAVVGLEPLTAETYALTTASGDVYAAKAIVVAAGLGRCTPRTLPALADIASGNILNFVPDLSVLDGQDIVIAGGGDSAVDWALAASTRAKSVIVVHRRARFRAHEASVHQMYQSGVKIIAPGEVTQYRRDGGNEFLTIDEGKGNSSEYRFDKFIMALGFQSDLSAMEQWGLGIDGFRIPVKPNMESRLPRVFAIGDVSEYEGKVRLIAVGFGEAAIAVNHAAAAIHPNLSVLPGHSTNEAA